MRKAFLITFLFTFLFSLVAFADSALAPQDFFSQILSTIQSLGGLSWLLKVSAIIVLVVSSMKVSFLNQLLWSRLGAAQAWVAPILGLLAGVLSLSASGAITLAGVMAYVSAGGGAVLLHELLDTIKAVPGLGAIWVSLIDVIENALGGPVSSSVTSVPPSPPAAS